MTCLEIWIVFTETPILIGRDQCNRADLSETGHQHPRTMTVVKTELRSHLTSKRGQFSDLALIRARSTKTWPLTAGRHLVSSGGSRKSSTTLHSLSPELSMLLWPTPGRLTSRA
jgi:hypothetical protein